MNMKVHVTQEHIDRGNSFGPYLPPESGPISQALRDAGCRWAIVHSDSTRYMLASDFSLWKAKTDPRVAQWIESNNETPAASKPFSFELKGIAKQ